MMILLRHIAALLFALMVSAHAAALTPAQQSDLVLVSDYLNRNQTLKARISQHNPDGSTHFGTLYISRPGRMRLEYDPPETLLLLASHKHFTLVDRGTNQVTHYPFFTTPAALLLSSPIDLDNPDIAIGDITRVNGLIHLQLTASDAHDDVGEMTLIFTTAPVRMHGWQVIDAADNRVTVVFDSLTHDIPRPHGSFFLHHSVVPTAP